MHRELHQTQIPFILEMKTKYFPELRTAMQEEINDIMEGNNFSIIHK